MTLPFLDKSQLRDSGFAFRYVAEVNWPEWPPAFNTDLGHGSACTDTGLTHPPTGARRYRQIDSLIEVHLHRTRKDLFYEAT